VWLEGLGQLKNPMTSSGIEPATIRLVASIYGCIRTKFKIFLGGGDSVALSVLWLGGDELERILKEIVMT
jgi:hypothetical protein